ncbi:MAG: SRPBCC family protein [Geodermatophilaceae bacterium]|nr:SRPBCC family protein [Geodermatophilaceae bacterium]MDQ3463793.1 SRPBCC family protein [Actinomycetota bacterium]
MPTIRRTVVAAKPVDTVFAYLADFANAEEWDAGTLSCRRLSGDGGVGTTYENVSSFRGRKTTLVYEVMECVENERLVLRGANKTVTAVDTMTFDPAPDGTRVTYNADFTFKGLAALLTPFLKKPLATLGDEAEKSLAAALARL